MQPTVNHVAPAPIMTEAQAWQAVDRHWVNAETNQRGALDAMRRCGLLLAQIKHKTPRGEWEAKVKQNSRYGLRMVQKVIRLAENWPVLGKGKTVQLLTLNEALDIIHDGLKDDRPTPQGALEETLTPATPAPSGIDPPKPSETPEGDDSEPPVSPEPPPEREPGDDTGAEGEPEFVRQQRAAKRARDKAEGKNGEEQFDLRDFDMHLGKALDQLNRLAHSVGLERSLGNGRAMTVVMTPEHAGFKRRIQELEAETKKIKAEVAQWHQRLLRPERNGAHA